MEVLLLGPLEVRSSGERLPLGGPRQRALLADLALHAGSVVSMDTLLDDLWHGEPPPAAVAVVQNAVHRLRGSLGREAIAGSCVRIIICRARVSGEGSRPHCSSSARLVASYVSSASC